MIDWKKVRYFTPREFDDPKFPGSGKRIHPITLLALVELREKTGWKIITHWKVGGCVDVKGMHGHAPLSYHRLDRGARAVDFHFDPEGKEVSAREQFYAVRHGRFTGIGVYYDWWWNGEKLEIGFHVDTRPVERNQMWRRENGGYYYLLD